MNWIHEVSSIYLYSQILLSETRDIPTRRSSCLEKAKSKIHFKKSSNRNIPQLENIIDGNKNHIVIAKRIIS